MIHERSGGIPRTISVLADNALLSGFALQQRPVCSEIVLDVCRDFDLPGKGESPEAAPSQPSAMFSPRPTEVVADRQPGTGRLLSIIHHPHAGMVPATAAASDVDSAVAGDAIAVGEGSPRRRRFLLF